MRIRALAHQYQVESTSRKGVLYDVFPDQPFCSCPSFRFQHLKEGGVCKHLKTVLEWRKRHESKAAKPVRGAKEVDLDAILAQIKAAEPADAVHFVEKYGEAAIDALKARGDVIERAGKLRTV